MRATVWLVGMLPLLVGSLLAVLFSQTALPNPVLYLRASLSTAVFLLGFVGTTSLTATLWWQRRQRQRYREQAAALHTTAAKDRRRFLQRLDHELKNPLMAMRAGLANASESGAGVQVQAALASIEAQTVRLSQLTADLRKVAELETRSLECAPVDMGPLLAEAIELAQDHPRCQGRHVALIVPQAPWPLPPVPGDRDLLFLAIYNLLENALKYTAVSDAIELRAREDGRFVTVEVADTGPGIAVEEQPYVWDDLYRGKAARGLPGSGLGLPLVKAIVERHRGQVMLSSRPGQGTLVVLRLPIA